jgi:peptidoglycan hydrolase-like protein with peptidoglycan-binding domain
MFLASKAVCAGMVFLLLPTGISGPRSTPLPSGSSLSKGVPGREHPSDVTKMQQTLQDQGHYRGKVDGVFGLRTRAGIRAYQKAENLPVTGQLDAQTAGRLGITPEVREEIGYDTTQNKPSAGLRWAEGSRRAGKTLRKTAKRAAAPESDRGHREKTLQAENGNQPQ